MDQEIVGYVAALDILLRGLYVKWAMESPTPRLWIRTRADQMINSLLESQTFPANMAEVPIWESANQSLRHFFRQIDARLDEEGVQV